MPEHKPLPAWLPVLLVLAVLAAYFPAWEGKPIWDDDHHLTRPELQSLHGLERIWIEPKATQQYYPLVHSAFWLEHELWGDWPLPYHLVNILLHATSALLLWRILMRLNIPGAFFGAAIFALHPVHVESVAWISELKNTLSGFFYLASALAYLRFDSNRSRRLYALALGLFLLGLMCKTVIATLPAALLVIWWWKHRDLSWKRDVLPLMPFFVTGMSAGLITAWVEQHLVGAMGKAYDLSPIERLLIAARAFWFYLGKLFWPAHLTFIYPRWTISAAPGIDYLYLVAAAVLAILLFALARRQRGPLAAVLYFGGTLFPALGFINVYPFRYSFVADHFQYLASIGIISCAAAGAACFLDRRSLWGRPLGNVCCVGVLSVLAGLTWMQSGMYVNSETVWRATLARNPNAFIAHGSLGNILLQRGDLDGAAAEYRKVLELDPADDEALNNLAFVLLREDQVDAAIAELQKALAGRPDYAQSHYNLGNALLRKGKLEEAIAHYRSALKYQPGYPEVYANLGTALLKSGQVDQAISVFENALQHQPDDATAQNNLAIALVQKGRVEEAITHFHRVIELRPGDISVRKNLGQFLLENGKFEDAISEFQSLLEIQPQDVEVLNNLAWILATHPQASLRDGARAVQLAEKADQLSGGRSPGIISTLAAACAEAGEYPKAIDAAQRALSLMPQGADARQITELRARIDHYQAHAPFRDLSMTNRAESRFQH